MKTEQKRVPLKELNLTDRFLFDEVMEDTETQEAALAIIFGKEISLLDRPETEKELSVSPLLRSIRMDVVSMDTEGVIYNTEMQDRRKIDLAKRSRYYQALVDTNLLEPGIPNYNLLNATYIIMICTFDLFGYGKYQYTFTAVCKEVPECTLDDQAVRIFLNTKGTNEDEVSEELVEFLHYVEDTTDEAAEKAKSERIRRVHERVCKVKTSEKVGVKYMQAWEEKYYEREEGRKEGKEEGLREGEKKGLRKGKAEGLKLARKVYDFLGKGASVEEIARECGLTEEEVRQLAE